MSTVLTSWFAMAVVAMCVPGDPIDEGNGKEAVPACTNAVLPAPENRFDRATDQDSDWREFRGPGGAGRVLTDEAYPDDLTSAKNLLWKVAVPEGHSSPVVVGDLVILTGFDEQQLVVLALSRLDGSTRWRREVPVGEMERVYHHGPATPTACSDGSGIYVVFGSIGVLAFDRDGKELWRQETPRSENLYGSAASPILFDEKLVVLGSDQNQAVLRAFHKQDGSLIWERSGPGPASTWSTPVVYRRGERSWILVYEPFHLRAFRLEDGSEAWSVPGLADEPVTVPQIVEDTVIVTSYNMRTNREVIGVPAFAAVLRECDADGDGRLSPAETETNRSVLSRPDADGEGDHPLRIFFRMLDENRDGLIEEAEWPRMQGWVDSFQHANGFLALRMDETGEAPQRLWQQEKSVPECPTPLCADGLLYAVRNGGVLTCLDMGTGKELFRQRMLPGGPYYASPVLGGGRIYFASARGEIAVVSAGRNPVLFSRLDLQEPVWATPALSGGCLIVRSKSTLWAFGDPALAKKSAESPAATVEQDGAPATARITDKLRLDARALADLVSAPLASQFLEATAQLDEPQGRTVYRDRDGGRAVPLRVFGTLAPAEQSAFVPQEYPPDFYYETGYGSPLVYARLLDLAAEHLAPVEQPKLLDFGYGSIGQLQLLAHCGYEAHGVDIEPVLEALYSESDDTGRMGTGTVAIHTGQWPADTGLREAIGGGYSLITSKNTLKSGYIHPAPPPGQTVDPARLAHLGVSDEEFLRQVRAALVPGGLLVIYNICPAQNPPDQPYIPYADGKSPFSRKAFQQAGLEVIAFDVEDQAWVLDAFGQLGYLNGQTREQSAAELFCWYTIVRRPREN